MSHASGPSVAMEKLNSIFKRHIGKAGPWNDGLDAWTLDAGTLDFCTLGLWTP